MASGGLFAGSSELDIRRTGKSVSVPETPKARLMHYMDCVANVLTLGNQNMKKLTDYTNYHRLSEEETDALLVLVVLFSPDELIGKVFFPSDELCRKDKGNEFYELKQVSKMFAVTNSIVIGGERKRVMKIMTFKMIWIEEYYLRPLVSFHDRIARIGRGLPGKPPERQQKPQQPPRSVVYMVASPETVHVNQRSNRSSCCTIM